MLGPLTQSDISFDPDKATAQLFTTNTSAGGKKRCAGTSHGEGTCEHLQWGRVTVKLCIKENAFASHHSIHKINDYM